MNHGFHMMTKKFPRQNSATPMLLILWVLLACLTGCAPEKETPVQPPPALKKLAKPLYPEFSDTGKKKELVAALENSLTYFSRIPSQRKFHFSGDVYTAGHVRQSLTTFLEFIQTGPGNDELNRFIKTNYAVYQAAGSNDRGEVLFTGYYEPSIAGSLTQDEQYRFPLYSEPEDLLTLDPGLFFDNLQGKALRMARVDKNNRVVPYFSRKEINAIEGFEKRAPPIAWLKDRTDRFFLEIQGSGRLHLKQGGTLRVHYHRKNGHAYRSIGRYLIAQREIPQEQVSMQSIRAWLADNPSKAETVFHHNPSFVFFKREKNGPLGSLGVKVSPMRSIATDSTLFPKGALCFIKPAVPATTEQKKPWPPYAGFVLNQDTGGAIKGPGRADFFYGNGDYAEFAAGRMNHRGALFFLVLE